MTKVNTDLRTPAAVPSKRKANLPGFTGILPFAPGKVISGQAQLTDMEKKMLKDAGWEEGQPIPNNIPEIINEQERLKNELRTALPASPDTPPFKPPKEINFDDLAPEVQQGIMKSIEHAKQQLDNQKNQASSEDTIEIVDSRKTKPTGYLDNPSATELLNQTLASDKIVPDPNPKNTDKVVAAGGAEKATNCAHCGWPVDIEDIEPSVEDKYNFLQAVLGQNRFNKTYKLLDGKLIVVLRTLTTNESDMLFRQLALDLKKERIESSADYYQKMMQYRLICCLERVELEKTGPLVCPEINEYSLDKPDIKTPAKDLDTPLYKILPHILETVLPQDSLCKVLIVQLARFMRLVEHLEARIDSEGFWSATEEQP